MLSPEREAALAVPEDDGLRVYSQGQGVWEDRRQIASFLDLPEERVRVTQVSTGGAEYLSGQKVKDMVVGAVSLAEFAHHVAKRYSINIALHTDHCPKGKLDGFAVRVPTINVSLAADSVTVNK